ncbi:hypothetical protein [Megamonas hypermegale]|uniref:hypothetical protein n=1 Tax=Megamonas hypermegale TaxID=158847 RepID=UPI0026ED08F3|nr:hypothetical protein [Megamonas hypermegale]
MESTKELIKLMGIRERLEKEYEYVAFKCRHGIGDVEANRVEAYRLGRILGMRNNDIRVDTQTKSDNIECKNPKNKSVIEYLDRMKKDVLNAEKEIDVFTMIAVSESFGIATGSIGSASQLTTAIAFLINDLESHSKKEVSLLPEISKMYLKVKNEKSGKHDSDD